MRRLLSILTLIGLLLISITACAMKKFPAGDFFSGPQLVLAQAIERGDLAKAQQLAPTTELNMPGRKGMTLLFFAVQEALQRDPKQLNMITLLVKAGADPLQEVPNFGDALGVVLNSSHPEFLRALLDGGVDPNTTTAKGTPIIFFTATEETLESLKLLICRGADANKRDLLRNTALVDAIASNSFDTANYLLDRGANPNTYNINGVSFAWQLQGQMKRQVENSDFWIKLLNIRDRIVKMGVKWPPESPQQIRARWGSNAPRRLDDGKLPL
ncbi:ankyrin repeat domain-containing protein [Trinickia mobilis]|uniref:ankyrin repeat domain-containing protein n=1 Tax=Trinickia mobilis TaxID=2816356 RepID=UPI001A8DA3E5|nr:ankyrin repeat domain-containing protein [Trinickia mobilis]